VSWWKEVAVVDGSGARRAWAATQDGWRGPYCVWARAASDRAVVLSKAKEFGTHRPMYQIDDTAAMAGSTLVFTWSAD
jgi:hypothetical protein